MKLFLLLSVALLAAWVAGAQTGSTGIGTLAPNPNTVLDIRSDTKAMLLPRTSDSAISKIRITEGMWAYGYDSHAFIACCGGLNAGTVTDNSATTNAYTNQTDPVVGQTYKAPYNFIPLQFGIRLGGTAPGPLNLNVYTGIGTAGMLLGSSTISITGSSSSATLYYAALTGISFQAGQMYTFAITNNPVSGSVNYTVDTVNTYPDGGFLVGNLYYINNTFSFIVKGIKQGPWPTLAAFSDMPFVTNLFNGSSVFTTNYNMRLTRSNNSVTLTLPIDNVSMSINGYTDILTGILPAGYRPATNTYFPIRIQNGGAIGLGMMYINTAGQIMIKPNVAAGTWNGANSGFYAISVTFPAS